MKSDEYTVRKLMKHASKKLFDAGIIEYENDARMLMLYVANMTYSELLMNYDMELDEVSRRRYTEAVNRRASHYPLQYITGTTGFMGYEFMCREKVLIPRFDTELLAEKALEAANRDALFRSIRVLDLCTGSGCVGISYYLKRLESGVRDDVILSDVSDYAIALAQDNAEELEAEVSVVKSDLFDAFEGTRFDIIISNPPYIESEEIDRLMPEVRNYEPRLALDGAADGLEFYRRITDRLPEMLEPGGSVLFEFGVGADEIMGMLKAVGMTDIQLYHDLADKPRVIAARSEA